MELKELIAQIEGKLRIEDVIGEYIPISKKGANYSGVCPFHEDSNPSLQVSPSKKIFKCFVCGAGGNMINFVQNFTGITFIETIKKLATLAHLDYSTVINEVKRKIPQDILDIWEVNQEANNFFKYTLSNESEDSVIWKYLKSRNLTENIITNFQFGFTKGNKTLFTYLTSKGYEPALLVKAGLCSKNETSNEVHDYFYNRLMIPIFSPEGNIDGFSGRTITDETPKYLNTKDTPTFKKSSVLYNFNNSKSSISIKHMAFLVEGFMDVVGYYRANINNVVGTMGTNLSENQITLLKAVTNSIVLSLDNDRAGIEATIKLATGLMQQQFKIYIYNQTKAKDIDELSLMLSPEELKDDFENNKISFFEFYFKYLIKINAKEFKSETIVSFIKVLSQTNDYIEIDFMLDKIHKTFGIGLNTLSKLVKQYSGKDVGEIFTLQKNDNNKYAEDTESLNPQDDTLPEFNRIDSLIEQEIRLIVLILKQEDSSSIFKKIKWSPTSEIGRSLIESLGINWDEINNDEIRIRLGEQFFNIYSKYYDETELLDKEQADSIISQVITKLSRMTIIEKQDLLKRVKTIPLDDVDKLINKANK